MPREQGPDEIVGMEGSWDSRRNPKTSQGPSASVIEACEWCSQCSEVLSGESGEQFERLRYGLLLQAAVAATLRAMLSKLTSNLPAGCCLAADVAEFGTLQVPRSPQSALPLSPPARRLRPASWASGSLDERAFESFGGFLDTEGAGRGLLLCSLLPICALLLS